VSGQFADAACPFQGVLHVERLDFQRQFEASQDFTIQAAMIRLGLLFQVFRRVLRGYFLA